MQENTTMLWASWGEMDWSTMCDRRPAQAISCNIKKYLDHIDSTLDHLINIKCCIIELEHISKMQNETPDELMQHMQSLTQCCDIRKAKPFRKWLSKNYFMDTSIHIMTSKTFCAPCWGLDTRHWWVSYIKSVMPIMPWIIIWKGIGSGGNHKCDSDAWQRTLQEGKEKAKKPPACSNCMKNTIQAMNTASNLLPP